MKGQLLAAGDFELQAHQIETGDQFGDRMLHLQPRIHFQKVEIAVVVGEELDRARVEVTRRARSQNRGFAHALPHFRV